MNILPVSYQTSKWQNGLKVSFAVIFLALVQDVLHAYFKGYHFYFSESLLFNTFWLLFLPLLFLQKEYISFLRARFPNNKVLTMALPIVMFSAIQLLVYPLIVFILSFFLFNHTFSIEQTLQFTLSQYLYITIIIYGVAGLVNDYQPVKNDTAEKKQATQPTYLQNLHYTSGTKTSMIAVEEIHYFHSQSPYIAVFTADKKILIPGTLTSLLKNLDPGSFIRVHKSAIVQVNKIESFNSRLNGDYDIIMQNNMTVRLSRNFSSHFKEAVSKSSVQHKKSSC